MKTLALATGTGTLSSTGTRMCRIEPPRILRRALDRWHERGSGKASRPVVYDPEALQKQLQVLTARRGELKFGQYEGRWILIGNILPETGGVYAKEYYDPKTDRIAVPQPKKSVWEKIENGGLYILTAGMLNVISLGLVTIIELALLISDSIKLAVNKHEIGKIKKQLAVAEEQSG